MSITIYANSNFSGRRSTLETGKYPTLNEDPRVRPTFPNQTTVPTTGIDKLSSIKVKPGTYAEFFITQGFRDGSFILFAGDYSELPGVNDKIDAVKVFDHDSDMFPIIQFYNGYNFTGFQQNLAATGKNTKFDSPFIVHDFVSSVKVPEGVTVTLFEHSNYKGRSLTLEPGNYPNLGIFHFNNMASSIQIVQNNLEVVNIEYVNIASEDGEPILIESIAQNSSSLEQQANLTLEAAYEESFTRSFSNSTLFGLEISRTATVGVTKGPLSASLSQTLTVSFENTFTFGREETKSRTVTVSKGLNVSIPPEHIAKAVMVLTPRTATIKAIYTLKMKGTNRTTTQEVIIEVKNASAGTAVIEKFTPVEIPVEA